MPETKPDAACAEECPACGTPALARDRVRSDRRSAAIDAVACGACGEWWFESAGRRLTNESVIRLGRAL